MKKQIAIILECKVDKSILSKRNLTIKKETSKTKFGKVSFLRLLRKKGELGIIFEQGGMSGCLTLPQCALPVFSTIYKEQIKNVFLLGFTGSLNQKYGVGSFLIPSNFVDFTKARKRSFLEEIKPGELFFYRMAEPFSPDLSKTLLKTVRKYNKKVYKNTVLAITEGPRFESSAEIKYFKQAGCNSVCLSGIPDVYFARELKLNYTIGLFVSNFGEGMENSELEQILETAESQVTTLTKVMTDLLNLDFTNVNSDYHLKYWMQKPDDSIYKLI